MKSTFKRLTTALSIGLFLNACAQDPFEGQSFVTEKPVPSIAPQVEPTKPQENYTLDYVPVMNFIENEEGIYTLSGKVPAPGKAILSIDNLPKGATYVEADQKLIWKPDFEAANDAKDPNITAKTHEIKIRLASTENPQSVWERGALMVVKDTARKFEVGALSAGYVYEQKEFVQYLNITCEDFPTGPFVIVPENLPVGATIKKVTDSRFEVRFTPTLGEVNVNNAQPNYTLTRPLDVTYRIAAPRGQIAVSSKWNLQDTRQRPAIIMPENLNQGLDVSFTVTSVDPNLEVQPKLELTSKPTFGKLTATTDTNTIPNTATMRVRWENIPPGKMGSYENLTFRACNYTGYKALSNCETKYLRVNFVAQTHTAPKIDRTSWPQGQKKEFTLNSNQYVSIPIKDSEDPAYTVKVEVFPKDTKNEVTWSNGQVRVQPKAAGDKSILITATSLYNMITAEAFEYTVPAPTPTPTPSPSPTSRPIPLDTDEEGDLR